MPNFVIHDGTVENTVVIPAWVVDLESFVRWAESSEYPRFGSVSYLKGTITVDLTLEQIFAHNQVKAAVGFKLAQIARDRSLGHVLVGRGAWLKNNEADFLIECDALFVSYENIRTGKSDLAKSPAAKEANHVVGSPEVVVEVLSPSSEKRDTIELREAYFEAGIEEYWLADGRGASVWFEILKRGKMGFVSNENQPEGWQISDVFGTCFRLVQSIDRLGNSQYTLETQR